MVEKVIGKTGTPIKARVIVYKAVLQQLLLYDSERWVMTDVMMTVLEVLHHRIVRQIKRMAVWRIKKREIGVGLSGHSAGGDRDLANK